MSFHGARASVRTTTDATGAARGFGDGLELHRGGKLVPGGHPVEHESEQHLRVEPGDDGVVAVVRQAVEAAERLPPLELQLDLPAQTVGLQAHRGAHALARHRGEKHHVARGFQHLGRCLLAVLLSHSLSRVGRVALGQADGDEASVNEVLLVPDDDVAPCSVARAMLT